MPTTLSTRLIDEATPPKTSWRRWRRSTASGKMARTGQRPKARDRFLSKQSQPVSGKGTAWCTPVEEITPNGLTSAYASFRACEFPTICQQYDQN